jgi:hypothetical protein
MNRLTAKAKAISARVNDLSLLATARLGFFFRVISPLHNTAVQEAHKLLFGKNATDTASALDSVAKEAGKVVSDDSSIDDDQELHFMKVRADSGRISESAVLSVDKDLDDSSSVSESGTYRGQGYCAFDYFEEDYVGYSGSF